MRGFFKFVIFFVSLTTTVLTENVFPKATCFDKPIQEGQPLSCKCTGNATAEVFPVSTASFRWPDQTNTSDFSLTRVGRELNGTNFTCVMTEAGQEPKSVVYFLQVAFGPVDANTTILGPLTFVTDGSRDLNLTCHVTDTHPPPSLAWSTTPSGSCDLAAGPQTCVFKPRVPEDDGGSVVCFAANPILPPIVSSSAYYYLNLSYPPPSTPDVASKPVAEVLRTGNTVTCTVSGGKPLVSSVLFNCSNPALPDRDDVITAMTSVSSSVIIDVSSATADVMVCTCRAVWAPEPELYSNVTVAEFLLEYQAAINSFAVNETSELQVLEEDNARVVFACNVTGRDSVKVTLSMQGQGRPLLGRTDDVTPNVTGAVTALGGRRGDDGVERQKVHTYVLTSARCQDTGTYTCSADSGYMDVSARSLRLTVSCPPRFYNGSTTQPPMLTSEGLKLYLVAHPLPTLVTYTFPYNSTWTVTASDDVIRVECRADDLQQFLVVCSLKRRAGLEQGFFGTYSMEIANPFGALKIAIDVNDADDSLISAQTAGLIGGLLGAFILVIAIVLLILCWKDSASQRKHGGSTDRLKDNEEDVEGSGVPSSGRRHRSTDSDPSIPFRQVSEEGADSAYTHSSHAHLHSGHAHKLSVIQAQQAASGDSPSGSPLAEVVPRSSDVIFAAAAGPKTLDADRYFSYDDFLSHSSAGHAETPGKSSPLLTRTNPAWEGHLQEGGGPGDPDNALYETGYMSVDLTRGKTSSPPLTQQTDAATKDGRSHSTAGIIGTPWKRGFITKIFLPKQSKEQGHQATDDDDDDDDDDDEGDDDSDSFNPHGHEYAQVVKKGKRQAAVTFLGRRERRSPSAEEGEGEERGGRQYEMSDMDVDTEEEKMVSIDMDDEDDDDDNYDDEGEEEEEEEEEIIQATKESKTKDDKTKEGTILEDENKQNERKEDKARDYTSTTTAARAKPAAGRLDKAHPAEKPTRREKEKVTAFPREKPPNTTPLREKITKFPARQVYEEVIKQDSTKLDKGSQGDDIPASPKEKQPYTSPTAARIPADAKDTASGEEEADRSLALEPGEHEAEDRDAIWRPEPKVRTKRKLTLKKKKTSPEEKGNCLDRD